MNSSQDIRNARRAVHAKRRGITLIDLLAVQVLIVIPVITTIVMTIKYGGELGFIAGVLSGLACWGVACAVSAWNYHSFQKTLHLLSTNYPSIFQIKTIPTDISRFMMAEGAQLKIGDYGWEAEPIHDDGLIYLQGLNEKWGVVWFGGFQLDQIEKVGPKPRSQYLLPETWYLGGPDAFPCPFPILSRPSADLGMPSQVAYAAKAWNTSSIKQHCFCKSRFSCWAGGRISGG